MDNNRLKGLLGSLFAMVLLVIIGHYRGMNVEGILLFFGKIILIAIPVNLLVWFLDKKGIINLKKEDAQQKEFQAKLKKDKKSGLWILSAFVGFVVIFMFPIYMFTNPEEGNPSVWVMDDELVKKYYWLFCLSYYIPSSYVFKFGRENLEGFKGKRIAHHIGSFFTFALFTTYIIGANDQPNLILVMSILCIAVTWVQYCLININTRLSKVVLDEEVPETSQEG